MNSSSSPVHPTFHYPPPPRHTTILPFVPNELPKPAHPANPFLARLIHRIKGAESPHHAAERIYDASHPEHKLELPPRRQFALHAPDSDLGPLLRARRIDHTPPKDTTSLTGLPITKTVISASNPKPCEQAVYTLTLAPPKPPRTNDWTIVEIERSDSS